MTEPEEQSQYFAVVVPVGEECYSKGHNLNPYEDGICCADCETVCPGCSRRHRPRHGDPGVQGVGIRAMTRTSRLDLAAALRPEAR